MTAGAKEQDRGLSTQFSPPPTTLRGRWLFLARVAWAAVAITALAIIVFSVPSSIEHYSSVCTATSEVCSERAEVERPTPEGVRALQDAGLSVRTYALLNVILDKVFQLVWFVVGALIFWRRSDERMALLVSTFLVSFGPVTVDTTAADALVTSHPAWSLPVLSVGLVGNVCVVLFFLLFPGGQFVPRWTRWLAVALIAQDLPNVLYADLYSQSLALERISLWALVGGIVIQVWSQVYRYRRVSTPAQRRQTKWVVFGTALGVAGTFPFQMPVDLSLVGGDTPLILLLLRTGFSLSFLLVPFSISVAVLRSHLFDIDLLINRTLVYGSLTTVLVAVYFGGVVGLQRLLSPLVGEGNQLVVVASTLAIAALFNPLRRRIQAVVDRRFYRKKYDARKTLEAFSVKLRDETDLNGLRENLVGVVRETVQPAHVSVWLRSPTETHRQGESPG